MKIRFFVILSVLFMVGVAIGTLLIPWEKGPLLPPTTPLPSPPPPMPTSSASIQYRMPAATAPFPETMPLYPIAPQKEGVAAGSAAASSFGIPGEPSIIRSTRGEYLLWADGGEKTVIVSGSPTSLSYTNKMTLSTLTKDADHYENAAKELISPYFPGYGLYTSSYIYLQPQRDYPNQVSSIQQATVIQINLTPTLGDVPVYTARSGITHSAWVQFTGDGEVVGFSLPLLADPQETGDSVVLVSPGVAIDALKQGNGYVAGYLPASSGDEPILLQQPPMVVTIKSISLGLLFREGYGFLIPVYIFRGDGYTEGQLSEITVAVEAYERTSPSIPAP